MSGGFAKRLIAILAAAAFGLVIAFVVTMVMNVSTLYGNIVELDAAHERLSGCIESGDVEGAYQASLTASDVLARTEEQLDGAQWNMLEVLPFIGDDVRCAEGLVQVSEDLVTKGVRPLLSACRPLANDEGHLDFGEALDINPLEGIALLSAVVTTNNVVHDCSERIAALPEPHSNPVRQAKEDVEKEIADMSAAFDSFGSVLGAS